MTSALDRIHKDIPCHHPMATPQQPQQTVAFHHPCLRARNKMQLTRNPLSTFKRGTRADKTDAPWGWTDPDYLPVFSRVTTQSPTVLRLESCPCTAYVLYCLCTGSTCIELTAQAVQIENPQHSSEHIRTHNTAIHNVAHKTRGLDALIPTPCCLGRYHAYLPASTDSVPARATACTARCSPPRTGIHAQHGHRCIHSKQTRHRCRPVRIHAPPLGAGLHDDSSPTGPPAAPPQHVHNGCSSAQVRIWCMCILRHTGRCVETMRAMRGRGRQKEHLSRPTRRRRDPRTRTPRRTARSQAHRTRAGGSAHPQETWFQESLACRCFHRTAAWAAIRGRRLRACASNPIGHRHAPPRPRAAPPLTPACRGALNPATVL